MRKQKQQNRRLSVYLIKEGYHEYGDVIEKSASEYEVRKNGKTVGRLYVKALHGVSPAWLSLFEGCVPTDLGEQLKNRNVSAVFLMKRKRRIFAIAFGYGRSLLKKGTWEERFGLKVVLNSIDREKVRIVDRKNLDTMLTHTRTQTSRTCAIEEFNLDVQQILLKAVMGEPKDRSFAQHISGADSLNISCSVDLGNINGKCDELLRYFVARDYQKEFPWVNNVSELANRPKIEELDQKLIDRIKAQETDRLFLAIPDIVDWVRFDGFRFGEAGTECFPDILLSDFIKTVRNVDKLSSDYLKRKRIFQILSETGVAIEGWTVYHCLNCEISDDCKTYILTESKWYEVDSSFVEQVNRYMKKVLKYKSIRMAADKDENEVGYCRRLHKSNRAHFALMDRELIQYGGGYSKMEFCDIFTEDRKLIHIKRYAGSSVLSHLFTQGVNSAKAFLGDPDFRKKVNIKLPASHKLDAQKTPISREYEVVFGIISAVADALPDSLPFFSKITLMRAVEELRLMGYKTSVAGIRISE